MAVFRENNISAMYTRNMFAMHSDLKHECLSVMDLGVLAGVGGVNLTDYTGRAGTEKSAFLVNGAVGGAATDGRLVTGAEPYWNKWANNSPGLWYLPDNSANPVYFGLKKDASNQHYIDLADFSLHDLSAPEPTPFGFSHTYQKGAAGSSTTFDAVLKIKTGNYNWAKAPTLATHCKCYTYDSSNNLISQSTHLPIDTSNKFITFNNVSFTVSTASIAKYEWTTKIVLCNSVGDDLAVIPVYGSIVIEIVAAVVNTLKVTIAGRPKVFDTGSTLIGGGSIYANGTYNSSFGISANYRTLNSITYMIYNSSTNEVVSQTTVTSFNAYEYPTVLDIYANGEQETFYASYGSGRPTPGAGQYLSVFMEYI